MSSNNYFFNRKWAVTLGATDSAGNIIGGQAKKYTDLRVAFDINKTSETASNKSKITVYNLSPESRESYQKGAALQLDAGYEGNVETLFIGDSLQNGVRSTRENSSGTVSMAFECGSSERVLSSAVYNKSYPPGTLHVSIIQDLVLNGMGLNFSNIGVVLGLPPVRFNSGVTLYGSVQKSLEKLLKPYNLEFFIDNKTINILPKSAHLLTEAIVVSSGVSKKNPQPFADFLGPVSISNINAAISMAKNNTGLIGVPSQAGEFVTFTSLLNTKLSPGALVLLNCETFAGYFRVRTSHFEGDSHGDKWQVTCECLRISAVLAQGLKPNVGAAFFPSASNA